MLDLFDHRLALKQCYDTCNKDSIHKDAKDCSIKDARYTKIYCLLSLTHNT